MHMTTTGITSLPKYLWNPSDLGHMVVAHGAGLAHCGSPHTCIRQGDAAALGALLRVLLRKVIDAAIVQKRSSHTTERIAVASNSKNQYVQDN
jgi:hypothetical protein